MTELEPAWPCPKCGVNLNRRADYEAISVREWLRHPLASFGSWRHRRWANSSDGIKHFGVMHVLINHGESQTLHELSPDTYAKWDVAPSGPEKPV